eukprot:2209048-Rhodomonas_salina.1
MSAPPKESHGRMPGPLSPQEKADQGECVFAPSLAQPQPHPRPPSATRRLFARASDKERDNKRQQEKKSEKKSLNSGFQIGLRS